LHPIDGEGVLHPIDGEGVLHPIDGEGVLHPIDDEGVLHPIDGEWGNSPSPTALSPHTQGLLSTRGFAHRPSLLLLLSSQNHNNNKGDEMLYYKNQNKTRARNLRKSQTGAEQILWHYLRRKQICEVRFARQKPIGPYIVDFYAKSARLVIELDGSQHYEEKNQAYDRERDDFLRRKGLHVLRFNNLEVYRCLESVIQVISLHIEGRAYGQEFGGYIELI
jgi:very-short-patch-repair endonuclease